jgi:hypothetical protein
MIGWFGGTTSRASLPLEFCLRLGAIYIHFRPTPWLLPPHFFESINGLHQHHIDQVIRINGFPLWFHFDISLFSFIILELSVMEHFSST